MQKNYLLLTLLTVFIAAAVFAQDTTSKGTEKKEPSSQVPKQAVTLQGYVVDAMCAKNMANKPTTMEKAAAHSKSCALEDDCASAGFGLFSDGKWYKFDAAGDAKAQEMIEKTKKKDHIAAEVKGTIGGDTFTVVSIKETKAMKPRKK